MGANRLTLRPHPQKHCAMAAPYRPSRRDWLAAHASGRRADSKLGAPTTHDIRMEQPEVESNTREVRTARHLNELFYAAKPWAYFERRMGHLALVQANPPEYQELMKEGVRLREMVVALVDN